jgi:hypothetical protein
VNASASRSTRRAGTDTLSPDAVIDMARRSKDMTTIAGREVRTPDLVLIVTGVVALVSSFLAWYKADTSALDDQLDGLPESVKAAARDAAGNAKLNGWNSGFLAWGGIVLLIVVAGLVAAKVFAGFATPSAGVVGPALLLLIGSGLAVLLNVIRLITGVDGGKASIGLYLCLVAGIVAVVFSVLEFQGSGEKLPEFGSKGPAADGPPPPPPVPEV